MNSLFLIPLICIILVAYLAGFEFQYRGGGNATQYNPEAHLSLIEFLTQHKTKTKEYQTPPKEYGAYQRFIVGKLEGHQASFTYEYPLINKIMGRSHVLLEPTETSKQVDTFGLPKRLVVVGENGLSIAGGVSQAEMDLHLNSNGWFFDNNSKWGVAYHKLFNQYDTLTGKIAEDLKQQLALHGEDNYFNRVQAALNFIQFIPYGQPNFDSADWYYHELSLPPESFILGYADCDSKSLFFAAILSHLIPVENIIIVHCMVKSDSSKTSGAHAMAAISDLGIAGESILHNNKSYLLIETTAPVAIGSINWISCEITEINPLV